MMKAPVPFHLTTTPLEKGTSLIEASAGTGKTYAITALVVRLILEENISIRHILVVTYTEAATEELRHRIRQTLAQAWQGFVSGSSEIRFLQELVQRHRDQAVEMQARLASALCGFDEAPIYTIHGFCQRTLKDRAFESGLLFDTELVTDPTELLQEVADDFWRTRFYGAEPIVMQFALKNKLSPDTLAGLLRTCINYPRLEFLSRAKGRALESLAAELEGAYQEARRIWAAQGDEIKACFGTAAKWGNRPYNCDETMQPHWDDLETCFSEAETAFEALSCLKIFCTAALEEGRSGRSKDPTPVHPFFLACETVCASEQLWLAGLHLDFVEFARQELPRRKGERKIQCFDDLLTRLDQALSGPAGPALTQTLRARFQAALIDEFQDTDPIQYQIFRRAFAGGSTFLFMIGDPKQAIYGFRGADIFTYLQAASEAGRHFTLGENWRSESGLVSAVNEVFGMRERAFVFDAIRFQPTIAKGNADQEPLTLDAAKEPPFQFWFWERDGKKELSKQLAEKTLPGVVASEIVRLLNGNTRLGERKLRPEDIAVLVLENKQASRIQEALNACGVPNVLHTTASLFDSQEAAEFQRVLAGIATPGNEPLVKSALATDLLGIDSFALAGFTENQWQEWLEKFHQLLHVWARHGFFRMFRQWMQQEGVRPRLLAFANGDRRLTNLLHLGEVLHQAETARRLGVGSLLKWLAEQMALPGQAPEEHQLRLERDDNAVRIVTVHKSKGLEYPVVFCPFSWKSSEIKRGSDEQVFFHCPDQGQRLVRDLGPEIEPDHKRWAKEERLAENVRLLYVALTRAKHRCYFVWGGLKGAGSSAPAWLLHRPPALDGSIVDGLDAHFKTLSDADLRAQLHDVRASADGAVEIASLPEATADSYQAEAPDSLTLSARQFTGRIRRDWMISSFTYLSAGKHQELPDRDGAARPDKQISAGSGMFGFPRGPKAGTCLHEILEQLDFAADEPGIVRLVEQRLQAHHLDQPGSCEAVCQMLHNLLRFPLDPAQAEFSLSKISLAERLNELEFFFPVKNLAGPELDKVLGRFGWSSMAKEIGRVTVDPINGFLKGFIDLVFRFEGRYYVLDWKSNWLGNAIEDYAQGALRTEMLRQHYFVQYHLYTVALHKYLALRQPAYSYDRHFGGVVYLFLRGIDPARPDHGAFRDRPPARAVEELSRLFAGQ